MRKQNKKLPTPRREVAIPIPMGRSSGLNTVNSVEEGQAPLPERPILNAFRRNRGEYIRQPNMRRNGPRTRSLIIGMIIAIVVILVLAYIDYFFIHMFENFCRYE